MTRHFPRFDLGLMIITNIIPFSRKDDVVAGEHTHDPVTVSGRERLMV
jgi:hypothetical protein